MPGRAGTKAAGGWVDPAVVVLATLLGAGLRLWGLGSQSLWYDEWLTLQTVGAGDPIDLLRHTAQNQGFGPVYLLVTWGWVQIFGDGEAAVRLVSAGFGIATIPVAYAAVVALGLRRTTARVTAVLVAVHPMLVWYSQEARPYALLALLGALSLLTFARARDSDRPREWLWWGLVAALALGTHYFAVFLVLAEGLALVARCRPSRRQFVAAAVPLAITLALLTPLVLEQRSHDVLSTWIDDFSLSYRLEDAGQAALVGPSPPMDVLWMASLAVVVLAIGLLVTDRSKDGERGERNTALLVGLVAGGANVLAGLVSVVSLDVFLSRYLIAALVPLVVVVAAGLTVPGRGAPILGLAATAALVGVCLISVVGAARDPELQRADWRSVAEGFEDGSGDRVLVMNLHGLMAAPLRHYLPDAEVVGPDETVMVTEIDVLVAKPTEEPCNFLVGRPCGLVFLGAQLPPTLSEDFVLDERVELDQFEIQRYRAPDPHPMTPTDLLGPTDTSQGLVLVLQGG